MVTQPKLFLRWVSSPLFWTRGGPVRLYLDVWLTLRLASVSFETPRPSAAFCISTDRNSLKLCVDLPKTTTKTSLDRRRSRRRRRYRRQRYRFESHPRRRSSFTFLNSNFFWSKLSSFFLLLYLQKMTVFYLIKGDIFLCFLTKFRVEFEL